MILVILFIPILIIAGLCSYLIARTLYKKLKLKSNKFALLIGIFIFLISTAAITISTIVILDRTGNFGR